MEDEADDVVLEPVFAVARGHLARAQVSRARINELWNSMRGDQTFRAWVESPTSVVREVWCSFEPGYDLQLEADTAMASFFRDIKAAMDACVLAAANEVCRPLGFVEPGLHYMPLESEPSEFDALPADGQLRGLRPDQIRAIRLLQPFTSPSSDEAARTIVRGMRHLAAGLDAVARRDASRDDYPLFTAWAAEANPTPELPEGVRIERVEVDPAGPLSEPKRLATFTLDEDSAGAILAGDPNVSFDVVANVGPWPDDPDDNFAHRSHGLIAITRHFIEGLERSVSDPYRLDLLRALDDNVPEQKVESWLPVSFSSADEEADVRKAIAESDRGMATYLNDDGTLVYMRLDEARVMGREIAPASDLLDDNQNGIAVEEATRAAAGRWGLPDLVLRPKVFKKGSGIRELGDGTILAGPRGISLQVKARGVVGDDAEKAAKWMLKNAAHGLRQARGTIRLALQEHGVELTNLRGRAIEIRGNSIEWIPVVVIEHPDPPPTGVVPAQDPNGPSVVLTRRDWEFLWDQLRSATAIVDYLHRVANEEPLELGAETSRYFDLAEQDAQAPATVLPDWIPESGASHVAMPLLPHDPAASADRFGHAIFQQILEDIADTDFTGDESDRITLLSHIDRVAVGTRAELGRLLLRRLTQCAEAAPSGHRMDHRIMYIDHGSLQVTFTTMSQLTDYHQEIYKSWLQLRRQDFLSRSGALGPIYPWTVGVLLTPRSDGPRPWDTTTISTNGAPAFDDAEYARLTEVFRPNA